MQSLAGRLALRKVCRPEPDDLRGRAVLLGIRMAGVLTRLFRFRGFYRAAKHIGRFAGRGHRCWVEVEPGSLFGFDLSDQYWSRLVATGYLYEPELAHLFDLIAGRKFLLLDCGANYGYWSVVATGETVSGPAARRRGGGCCAAIAVEASPPTYACLVEVAAANGYRFRTVHGAVLEREGEVVEIGGGNCHHSARGVAPDGAEAEGPMAQTVGTVSLDGLLAMAEDHAREKGCAHPLVFVKLDVEGAEERALSAARELWKREILVVYEDHSNEREHGPTKAMLGRFGMEVYHVSDQGEVMRIVHPGTLDAIKVNPNRGYNFAAVRTGTSIAGRMAEAARAGQLSRPRHAGTLEPPARRHPDYSHR